MKKKKASLHVMKEEETPPITPETFPKSAPVPVLAGLPEYLKDPEVYPKIRKALIETLSSTHSHSDLLEWSACGKCQQKVHEHAEMVRKLGFLSPAQYRAWCRVHEKITERVKLR